MNMTSHEELPTTVTSRDTILTKITEDYIIHVSEENEGTVTKPISQILSRTKKRIQGYFPKLDDFF